MTTPHRRVVSALRELASAFEELDGAKPARKPRRRGPLPLSAEEKQRAVDPDVERQVEARLVANGWRSR